VPAAAGAGGGDRLLHLDLHPFNILLDDDDQLCGVLDWANTAAGPAAFDRARTHTILQLDPQARQLAADASWAALVTGWTDAAQLGHIPAPALAWACRYLLNDLAHRYHPDQLAHVHTALRDAESTSGT
jgi:aminoglycoside phosphotransferase (APT) family kinase protein